MNQEKYWILGWLGGGSVSCFDEYYLDIIILLIKIFYARTTVQN